MRGSYSDDEAVRIRSLSPEEMMASHWFNDQLLVIEKARIRIGYLLEESLCKFPRSLMSSALLLEGSQIEGEERLLQA